MPGFDVIGWIVIGFLAGSISGWFAKTRSVEGCLPTIVVGIVGALIGGWLATQLGGGPATGFGGALVLAIVGSILIRIALRAVEGGSRR